MRSTAVFSSLKNGLRVVGQLVLAFEHHPGILVENLSSVVVSQEYADDDPNLPDSSSSLIIEDGAGRAKAPDVAGQNGVRAFRVCCYVESPCALCYLFHHRVGESLLYTIVLTGILKDGYRHRPDIGGQPFSLSGGLVAADAHGKRERNCEEYWLEHCE